MRKILCLSTSNYYPFPTRKQNIMNRMTDCTILYVDPPVTLIAPLKDPKARERLSLYKEGPKQALPNLKVYAQPPVLPFFNKRRQGITVHRRFFVFQAAFCETRNQTVFVVK